MSTGDFLFQGNAPTDFTNVVDQNASLPQWWQDAAQGLIARASSIAGQPYQAFPGPTVAPLDPLQENAISNANTYTGNVNGILGSAGNTLNTAANNATNGLNTTAFNSYLSPFTNATNSVNSDLATLAARNLSENLLPAVNDTFIRAGQFGSSGNSDFTERALRDTQQSLLQAQDQNLMNATNTAENNALAGNTQAIQAGAGLGALGASTGQENRSQLEMANLLGQENQQQAQNNLNAAQTAFANQTNYPWQMAQNLNGIIRGYQPTASQTSTGTSPLSGTGTLTGATNLLNAGSAAAGALGSLFKQGGIVTSNKNKGK